MVTERQEKSNGQSGDFMDKTNILPPRPLRQGGQAAFPEFQRAIAGALPEDGAQRTAVGKPQASATASTDRSVPWSSRAAALSFSRRT